MHAFITGFGKPDPRRAGHEKLRLAKPVQLLVKRPELADLRRRR